MLVLILVGLMTNVLSSPTRQQRLSLAEWGTYSFRDHKGPGTYAFGYDIEDPFTNNIQFRQEERHRNGTVTGSYGYVDPDGQVRILHYVADNKGYRVNEDKSSISNSRPKPELQKPPTTTLRPIEQDDEYFEGEFYPSIVQVENDVDDHDNTQPIQFPVTFPNPTPVFEDINEITLHTFSNDATQSLTVTQKPTKFQQNYLRKFKPVLIYRNPYGGPQGWLNIRV